MIDEAHTQQSKTKKLEYLYSVKHQTLEIVTRPSFRADNMFVTGVQRLLSKLNAGYQPPFHFNIHKLPYKDGFTSLRTRGALVFSHSQPDLSGGYPAILQLNYEHPNISSGKSRSVFLVFGTCQVSTRWECRVF